MSTTPTDPIVEMLVDGAWVDITNDCRLGDADSGGGIDITRGRPNEGNSAEPTQVEFTLNNGLSKVDATLDEPGVYSRRNATGPYYGLLQRNQPVRVGLGRRSDDFTRSSASDTWGSLPDRVDRENVTIAGEEWNCLGTIGNFDLTGTTATIQAATGTQMATFGRYGDVEVVTRMKASNHTSEMGVVLRLQSVTQKNDADGTFENGVGDFAATGGSWAQSSTDPRFGSFCGLLTVSGSPVTAYVRPVSGKRAPVVEDGSYRVRAFVKASFTGNILLAWDWYDEDENYLSTDVSGSLAVTADTWFWVEYTATAPASAAFGGYGPTLTGSPSNGTTLFVDNLTYLDLTDLSWYSAYINPQTAPTADRLRIGKVAPGGVSIAFGADFEGGNYVADTWYWLKAQISGHRLRMKFWEDGDDEPTDWHLTNYDNRTDESIVPTYGEVGLIAAQGSGLVTFDSIEVNQWRAHAEISQLPPKWDLSRQDRWVPIAARGIIRRLGQGQKAEKSAVRLHLQRYTPSGLWFPLEEPTGDIAGNAIQGGTPGVISQVSFATPELTGDLAMPGVSGYADFLAGSSSLTGQILQTPDTGSQTLLFFFKFPANPATETLWCTVTTTGTARIWRMYIETGGGIRIDAFTRDGAIVSTDQASPYVSYADGVWIAATLYLTTDGANVDWAFNYHNPGGEGFFTANGTFAGTVGIMNSVNFRSSSALATAGGFSLAHVFHYGEDLPFVTDAFARAAYAYDGETAATRFLRLTDDAGIAAVTQGTTSGTEAMGFQLPKKLMDLLEECAETEGGFLFEDRDSFALGMHMRQALMNIEPIEIDIDQGHLTAPLETTDDDQNTRNAVTVTRVNGGFAVSIQETGPLNIQDPGSDPEAVGIYDEDRELSMETDLQLQAAADWFRARGTIDSPRYPSLKADLAASAYQEDPDLVAQALRVDSGRQILLSNSEVTADKHYQLVQSYTEHLDQYEHDLTFVSVPGELWYVGVTGSASEEYRDQARVQPAGIETTDTFTSGTDTVLECDAISSDYGLWALTADDARVTGFDIMVAGVQLTVVSITGSGPQDITVEQTPVNGVIKAIPVGSRITLAKPARVAW